MITQVPKPTATTVPLDTMQTDSFELAHLTSLLDASSGITVATSWRVSPILCSSQLLWLSVIPVTGCETVTLHESTARGLSSDVALINAIPRFSAETFPSASTVTISLSVEVQMSFLLSAFTGVAVAYSISLCPTFNAKLCFSMITPTTGCLTVTIHCAE